MSLIASLIDRFFPIRLGSLTCDCGAVQLEVTSPGSSYALVEQTTALCHCQDCTTFCRACRNGSTLLNRHGGSQMVQFYRSDVKITKGTMAAVRLYEKTPLIRCYCADCQTPLGALIASTPVMLLYHDLLRDYPIFTPHLVLNCDHGAAQKYDRNTVVRPGMIAPWFLLRLVARVLLGFLFGKNSSNGSNVLVKDEEWAPVGLQAILLANTDKTK